MGAADACTTASSQHLTGATRGLPVRSTHAWRGTQSDVNVIELALNGIPAALATAATAAPAWLSAYGAVLVTGGGGCGSGNPSGTLNPSGAAAGAGWGAAPGMLELAAAGSVCPALRYRPPFFC